MTPTLLPMLLMAYILFFQGATATCTSSRQIECKSGGQCIDVSQVCRSGKQCTDGSDEDPRLCEIWKDVIHCYDGQFKCRGNCYYSNDFCNRVDCSNLIDHRVCKMIKEKKLYQAPESMNLTTDMMTLLKDAVNFTSEVKFLDCPFLYTKVGNQCVSFFSPAKVPWPEARQFCRSIFGDLLVFRDLAFQQLLDYMKESLLTSDYWIGGRYDLDTNSWSWTSDDSPMPLGTPYWGVRYSQSCVPRSPPHTNPFRNSPDALPGAPCFNYLQAPTKREQGWCSALTYKHFYYITDEMCQDARSPLCILNIQPTHEEE